MDQLGNLETELGSVKMNSQASEAATAAMENIGKISGRLYLTEKKINTSIYFLHVG